MTRRPHGTDGSAAAEASYAQFEFEGRLTPLPDELAEMLPAIVLGHDRAWILRAAVVSEPLAEALIDLCHGLLDRGIAARSIAVAVARALCARRLVPEVSQRMFGQGWLGTRDPHHPRRTLAQSALWFVVEALGPSRARPQLVQAMALPELRVIAYGALAAEEPDLVLPHLEALLNGAPGLAPDVAIRFALVHTDACEAACEAISGVPEETLRAFADALKAQLHRIGEIRRWVACRRILFGR